MVLWFVFVCLGKVAQVLKMLVFSQLFVFL